MIVENPWGWCVNADYRPILDVREKIMETALSSLVWALWFQTILTILVSLD